MESGMQNMELHEVTYHDDSDPSELSYQRGNRRLRWYESERSNRDYFRSLAIVLLIIVCIVLYLDPKKSVKTKDIRGTCAEPNSILNLKASSTGEQKHITAA